MNYELSTVIVIICSAHKHSSCSALKSSERFFRVSGIKNQEREGGTAVRHGPSGHPELAPIF